MEKTNFMPGEIPSTFEEVLYWRITQKTWRIIVMNILAITLTGVIGLGFLLLVLIVSGPSVIKFCSSTQFSVTLLVSLLLVFPLHELIHGLAMKIFDAKPKYGFIWKGLMFYATAPGHAFKRNQYLVIALAPLVSVTILAALSVLILANYPIVWILALCATINGGGAIGDLWICAIVFRFPPHAYVIDERDGMRIFLPKNSAELK